MTRGGVRGKQIRNSQIYLERASGRTNQEIAIEFNISVSRVQQIFELQKRLRSDEIKAEQETSKIVNWREMPVYYARISVRLCNVLRNMDLKTMGEVADDWLAGKFDKRLPVPNCGNATIEELENWLVAHLNHTSVEKGANRLLELESIRLNEYLGKVRSKIEGLQMIERRIVRRLERCSTDSLETTVY